GALHIKRLDRGAIVLALHVAPELAADEFAQGGGHRVFLDRRRRRRLRRDIGQRRAGRRRGGRRRSRNGCLGIAGGRRSRSGRLWIAGGRRRAAAIVGRRRAEIGALRQRDALLDLLRRERGRCRDVSGAGRRNVGRLGHRNGGRNRLVFAQPGGCRETVDGGKNDRKRSGSLEAIGPQSS